MESIAIRYGERLTLPLETGEPTAVTAEIFIGNPGENFVLSKSIDLIDGNGTFEFTPEETSIPLGTYSYQINVTGNDWGPEKYPSPALDCDDCSSDLPKFIIHEALDEIEVTEVELP